MKKRLPWLLYQPYKWLVFMPVSVLSTLLFGFIAVVLSIVVNPRVASFVSGVTWARVNAFLTPMRVSVEGRENVDPDQSYVIVANHQSHYDVFVLYGWLGIDFKWVMKQELRKVPGLGIACEKVGHIFIDRSNRAAALRALAAAREKICNGTSVIFFPEGTRSRGGQLARFKKGAFRMALDLELPILPVTIVGTRRILPPETIDVMPGRARLRIHPPVEVGGCDEKDVPELMARVREVIGSALPG